MHTLFDRQPFENADEYGPLMKELADNEERYAAGQELRPILVRNKDLLAPPARRWPGGCIGGPTRGEKEESARTVFSFLSASARVRAPGHHGQMRNHPPPAERLAEHPRPAF
jgi:hypothetical protein